MQDKSGLSACDVPTRWNLSMMLPKNLAAAGTADRDESGYVVDFHPVRHTYISRLVASGANIRVAQELARHSTPTLGDPAHPRVLGNHDPYPGRAGRHGVPDPAVAHAHLRPDPLDAGGGSVVNTITPSRTPGTTYPSTGVPGSPGTAAVPSPGNQARTAPPAAVTPACGSEAGGQFNERIARDKIRKLEYELATGNLPQVGRLPLPVILEAFCAHIKAKQAPRSIQRDISHLRNIFGEICESLKYKPTRRADDKQAEEKPFKMGCQPGIIALAAQRSCRSSATAAARR